MPKNKRKPEVTTELEDAREALQEARKLLEQTKAAMETEEPEYLPWEEPGPHKRGNQ